MSGCSADIRGGMGQPAYGEPAPGAVASGTQRRAALRRDKKLVMHACVNHVIVPPWTASMARSRRAAWIQAVYRYPQSRVNFP